MDHIQTVKIHDVEDGESYTAKIQKNGKRWMGWIQEHPKVKCEADTHIYTQLWKFIKHSTPLECRPC